MDAAAFGIAGQWLLDPRNVTIENAATSGGSFSSGTFTPTADNAVADRNTIQTTLNAGTDVTITTGSDGTQAGDITVADSVTWTSANILNLNAAGKIIFNAAISGTNGTLQLTASNAVISPITSTIDVKTIQLAQGDYQLGSAERIGDTNAVTVIAATFDLNDFLKR